MRQKYKSKAPAGYGAAIIRFGRRGMYRETSKQAGQC